MYFSQIVFGESQSVRNVDHQEQRHHKKCTGLSVGVGKNMDVECGGHLHVLLKLKMAHCKMQKDRQG